MTIGRLPDFIFGRMRDIERETGLELAGTLVTDIPKHRKKITKADLRLLNRLIRQLAEDVRSNPYIAEVGIWRNGSKPADGLSPPFDDKLMKERCKRCLSIAVRVGVSFPGGINLDSDLRRQMKLFQ